MKGQERNATPAPAAAPASTAAPVSHATAPEDRVPLVQKMAIGMGEISSIGRQSIEQLSLPVYNITLGVSPVLVTTVLSVVRFLQSFMVPIAGSVSDNTTSRFGRRKPYMFVACLLCGVILPLLWMPPAGWSENGYIAYFFVSTLVFFTAYSFFDVPLIALALEATPDYHERTRVAAWKSFFVHSMGILSAWLFAITQLSSFDNTMQGARFVGLGMGALMLCTGMVPVFLVREGYRRLAVAKKGLPLLKGIRETFVNKSFVLLSVVAMGNNLAGNLVQGIGLYLLIFHVFGGDARSASVVAGLWGTVYQISSILSIPLVTWLARTRGKVGALYICLWTLVAGSLSKWFTYEPDMPYLTLVTAALLGPGQTAFYTLVRAIIADICDQDELVTGLRREGMYASMNTWLDKATGSLALALTGGVLVAVGFRSEAGATQSAETLLWMRVAYIMLPIIGVFLAMFVLRYFPLTEQRMYEIRQELERRRGKR